MSRTLKLVLLAAVLEMTLVAVGVAVWRWDALANLDTLSRAALRRTLVGTFGLAFFPAWLALGAWLAAWKMARPGPRMASDTRRYHDVTLMAAAAFAVGVQAWTAGLVLGVIPHNGFGLRLVEALSGVFFVVAGNFAAKTSPPIGPGAPDPAVWARGMLRVGWVGVAAGLVIVIAAITVAINQMLWIIFAATVVYAAASVLQRRAMRPKPA